MKTIICNLLVIAMLVTSTIFMSIGAIAQPSNETVYESELFSHQEEFGDMATIKTNGISWSQWSLMMKDMPVPLGGYEVRGPIRINNDTDFAQQVAAEGWLGTGIDGDPYVIQGYEIDGEDLGNCIYIGNTTVHFELRDNYIYNASGNNNIYFRRTGIYLHNVTNGTIGGNIGYNNGNHGIYLESSHGNVLEGNTMYENRRGIKLIGESDGNTIRDNVANSNLFGINIRETSSHNLVVNNTVIGNERGIYVNVEVNDRLITNTVIIGNIVNYNIDTSFGSGYGISVRSNHLTRRIEYTTIDNNTLDGNDIGIYIFRPEHNTVSNNEVKNSTGTGIWFGRSDNNIVINNTAINNSGRGFYISRVTSSDFVNNTIINNSQDGVHITGDRTDTTTFPSTGNTITGSIVKNNGRHGVYMDAYTRSNTYSNNTITNNTGSGIYLADQPSDQTRNNHIENNIISLNGEHGIYMCESRLITLLNNTMLGNGIYIEGASENRWNTHTIDTNNTVDGRPVHYLKDAVGGVVPEGAGQVILAKCQGTTVENQEFSNATLLLGYSEEIEIRNVTISVPYLHGIYLYRSHLCNIIDSAFVDAGVSGIYASLSDDLYINKTSVTGSGGSGIHLSSSHRGVVDDNSIYIAGNGLEIESSNDPVIIDNIIFSNNRGIYIHSGSTNYDVHRNHLFDNNDGLHLNGAGAGQLIYGNNASDNNRHGIYISSSGENIIENNTIASNNDDGIHVRTSVSWIVNNTLSYNGNDGVYIERTANGHMINNTITDSGRWGMYTRGATGWQIKNNFIFGYNHNFAIYKTFIGSPTVRTGGHFISNNIVTGGGIVLLYPNQPSIIEGNTITDYSERGIRLDQFSISGYSSTGNIVSNNSLVAHPDSTDARGIFVCPDCPGTVIENNTIDNGMNGIFMGSVDNLVQRNKVSNLTQFGIVTGTSSQNNRIEDNTVLNSHYGFYLRGSDHVLFGNTIHNSSLHGIYAYDVHNTLVENNTINKTQDNGIEIHSSSNLEVYNNTIIDASLHGIHLSSADSCTLKGNAMHGTGIMLNGWDASNWNSHTIDENNTVNALPVKYRAGITDGNVSGNLGQVIIADCTGMTLSNLTIENGGVAVLLGFADGNIIVNSTLMNNSYGIYLYSSSGNLIYHNNFINNTEHAYDNGDNSWDAGYPAGGNYWDDHTSPDERSGEEQNEPGSDGIVDEHRDIEGGANRDNFPWTTPGGWGIVSPGVVITAPTSGETWISGTEENITWNTTPGDGTIIGVDIYFSDDGGSTWDNIVTGAPDTGSYTWMVPDNSTTEAMIRLTVHDDNGRSASTTSDEFTIGTPPSAPLEVEATPGDQEILLEWNPPLDPGSSDITEYRIYRGTEPDILLIHHTVDGSISSYLDDGLTNGFTYYYKVSAVNSEGEGELSNLVSATPATTPSSPQDLLITPGDEQIYLEWEPPLNDGGAEVTNYTVYRGTESGVLTPLITLGDVLQYTDEDVDNGITYYYVIAAVNWAGEGELSDEVNATPATTPSSPQNLQATPGDEQVYLEWEPPLNDGGANITNYTVYRGTESGVLTHLITLDDVLNYTDEDVTNGVTYYYAVAAVNWAGEGELSEEISTTPMEPNTPPSPPSQPTPEDDSIGINTTVILSVVVTDPNGDTMDVRFHNANDNSLIGTANDVPSGGTASLTWTGLSELTQYSWYVVADDGQDTTISQTWSFVTGDFTAPIISDTVPDDQETDISIDTTMVITFSKAMEKDSVEDNFDITPYVDGTFSWNHDNTVLTYTLSEPMEYSTTYVVTIGEDAQDTNGNSLGEDYTFSFTTEEESVIPDDPPVLIIHTPSASDEYQVGVSINITYSATDDNELPQYPITIEVSYDGGSTWEYIAEGIENTGYHIWIPNEVSGTVRIRITCIDSADQTTTEHTGDFKIVDTIPPMLTRTVPRDQDIGVRISTLITFEFDKEISGQSIVITLNTEGHNVAGTWTLSPGGRSIVFTPTDDLDHRTLYTVNITVEDLHGNEASYGLSFTTEGEEDDSEPSEFNFMDYWWLLIIVLIIVLVVIMMMFKKKGDTVPQESYDPDTEDLTLDHNSENVSEEGDIES